MIAIFSLLIVSVLCQDQDLDKFVHYVHKHNKNYKDANETIMRLKLFKNALNYIDDVNSKHNDFQLELNHLADRTPAEKKEIKGNMHVQHHDQQIKGNILTGVGGLNDSFDWRTKGVVTPIKNQGQCGSCWSFAASGAIEGAYALKFGNLVSFSEQQFVDCTWYLGNMGCWGGWWDKAFQYAQSHGVETEANYTYNQNRGYQQGQCIYNQSLGKVTVKSIVQVIPKDPVQLMLAVQQSPVAVGICSQDYQFDYYSRGVLNYNSCNQIDHAVLLIGYGNDSQSGPYWLLKNSWDTWWGEQGYFRLKRNMTNNGIGQNGLQQMGSYVLLN